MGKGRKMKFIGRVTALALLSTAALPVPTNAQMVVLGSVHSVKICGQDYVVIGTSDQVSQSVERVTASKCPNGTPLSQSQIQSNAQRQEVERRAQVESASAAARAEAARRNPTPSLPQRVVCGDPKKYYAVDFSADFDSAERQSVEDNNALSSKFSNNAVTRAANKFFGGAASPAANPTPNNQYSLIAKNWTENHNLSKSFLMALAENPDGYERMRMALTELMAKYDPIMQMSAPSNKEKFPPNADKVCAVRGALEVGKISNDNYIKSKMNYGSSTVKMNRMTPDEIMESVITK
jgi:hypothetical protein